MSPRCISRIFLSSLICLGFGANATSVLDLKLQCSVDYLTRFSKGEVERTKKVLILEISDDGYFQMIAPQSDDFGTVVSTPKAGREVANFSDTNKWDIQNEIIRSNGKMKFRYIIDRNTGRIVYTHLIELKSGQVTVDASGVCQKVSHEKRLF